MRIAFIGGFGHHSLRAITKTPEVEHPVAFAQASPDDPGGAHIAEFAGDLKIFADPIRLLDEYKPDIVGIGAICSRRRRRASFAAALEREIDVVSDKPIAATWELTDGFVHWRNKPKIGC